MPILQTSHEPGTIYNPFCKDSDTITKQKFLLICLSVAGKRAVIQQQKVEELIQNIDALHALEPTPVLDIFSALPENERYNYIDEQLRKVKLGQYKRLTKALCHLTSEYEKNGKVCPSNLNRYDLIQVPGIGLKTASFFCMYAQYNPWLCILDTHILQWLRSKGIPNVPKTTPTDSMKYIELERKFLNLAAQEGITPVTLADFDFNIWSAKALL